MRIFYESDGDVLEIRLTEADWVNAADINMDTVAHLDSEGRLAAIEILGDNQGYPLHVLALYSTESLRSLSQIGKVVGLVPDSLKHAAQRGKLKAVKIGRNWATTRSRGMNEMSSLGSATRRFPRSSSRSFPCVTEVIASG